MKRCLACAVLGLALACQGIVEGNPGASGSNARPAAVRSADCTEVRGSKYTVCATINGSDQALGQLTGRIIPSQSATGTAYVVTGANYAH